MKNCHNALAFCLAFVYFVPAFAQIPKLTVNRVASPIHCLGQSYYKFVIQSSGGVVTVNKGTIVADTITNVEEGITPLIVTLTAPNGQTIKDTTYLPAVDPLLPPILALVPSYIICENSPLPLLKAFVSSSDVTVDWYDQPVGGTKIATGTLTYQPTEAKSYYALSRDTSTGCVASTRAAATLIVKKSVCALVMAAKVRI